MGDSATRLVGPVQGHGGDLLQPSWKGMRKALANLADAKARLTDVGLDAPDLIVDQYSWGLTNNELPNAHGTGVWQTIAEAVRCGRSSYE